MFEVERANLAARIDKAKAANDHESVEVLSLAWHSLHRLERSVPARRAVSVPVERVSASAPVSIPITRTTNPGQPTATEQLSN